MSDREKIAKIFEDALSLYDSKNLDYGDAWKEYGLKGSVFVIGKKSKRLKNLVWFNKTPMVKDESVKDTLIDLIVNAAFGIINLEEKNIDGRQ